MNQELIQQLRSGAVSACQRIRQRASQVPAKFWALIVLFLAVAATMAIYAFVTAADARLHVTVQHSLRTAGISVWVDGDLAYSGKIVGSPKKKLGLIPTGSVQGSLSTIIPVRSGQHRVRVRIEPEDAAIQEDSIAGDFVHGSERNLSVYARQNGLSLNWSRTEDTPGGTSTDSGWLSHYAGALFLTVAGSIVSALTGYAMKELPNRFRPAPGSAPKPE